MAEALGARSQGPEGASNVAALGKHQLWRYHSQGEQVGPVDLPRSNPTLSTSPDNASQDQYSLDPTSQKVCREPNMALHFGTFTIRASVFHEISLVCGS